MIDLCQDWQALTARIDRETDPDYREWQKANILRHQIDWLRFVGGLTEASATQIAHVLDEFQADQHFVAEFAPRLWELERMEQAGDLRFHSLTLYCLVRLRQPHIIIETGVASGKSTAMILLALEHNEDGWLYSIDRPNEPGAMLEDGALTNTRYHESGWLVPQYLHGCWGFSLGDAKRVLPRLVHFGFDVELFLHDSLHTDEHVTFELETVTPYLQPGSLVLVDNADMTAIACEAWLEKYGQQGWCYHNLMGVRWR